MKTQSLKDMALRVVTRDIEKWQKELERADPNKQFDTANFKLKLTPLLDALSGISDKVIDTALFDGSQIEVGGRLYPPAGIRIVKQYYASSMAATLVEAHDRRQSHHIPVEKLFTPSMFPKLDYAQARAQWVILGETQRVEVANASNDQWRLHDVIKNTNFEAQEKAFRAEVDAREKRERLFRLNPDCVNTDALMRKLGAWRE